MERVAYGLTQHNCETAGRTIFLPIGVENYNSRVIVGAKCFICGKAEFEKQIDRTVAPTKGFYMTV